MLCFYTIKDSNRVLFGGFFSFHKTVLFSYFSTSRWMLPEWTFTTANWKKIHVFIQQKQGKKVSQTYCLPKLSLLAYVYLLLFPRKRQNAAAELSDHHQHPQNPQLQRSLVNCLRLRRKAVKTLKETMSAICICLFSAHHGHGSVDHNNTSSSAEHLHGGHGNNRPRLRSHANNTLPTEQHHSHLPVSIMGGGTSRWDGKFLYDLGFK